MRHNARHNTRTGGVNTKGVRHVQRRVLVNLLHLSFDEAKRLGKALDHSDVWVHWNPKRHMPNVTEAARVTVSNALKSLERRRLVMVRRHEGGRAHAVRLTSPGLDLAFELVEHGGVTADDQRARLAASLPADVRAFVPTAWTELRSRDATAERRKLLRRFVDLYDTWTRGADGVPPGSSRVLNELYEIYRVLTS